MDILLFKSPLTHLNLFKHHFWLKVFFQNFGTNLLKIRQKNYTFYAKIVIIKKTHIKLAMKAIDFYLSINVLNGHNFITKIIEISGLYHLKVHNVIFPQLFWYLKKFCKLGFLKLFIFCFRNMASSERKGLSIDQVRVKIGPTFRWG